MAMLLGAAALLIRDREAGKLPMAVRLVFQPAEEVMQGATTMIEGNALQGVLAMYGLHVDNRYDTGTFVIQEGCVNAAANVFRLEVQGKGGHGARPHQTVDAIVVASAIVSALQTIVARELDPSAAGVVSVGSFHAGTASNAIAPSAVLQGTARSLSTTQQKALMDSVSRIAHNIAAAHGATVQLESFSNTPPIINSRSQVALARLAAKEVVPEHCLLPRLKTTNMGGEDFAFYLQRVPGCFVRLGVGRMTEQGVEDPEDKRLPAHSSGFDVDEKALRYGAAYLASVARHAGQLYSRTSSPVKHNSSL